MELKNVERFAADMRRAVEEEKIPGAVLLAGCRGETMLHETSATKCARTTALTSPR